MQTTGRISSSKSIRKTGPHATVVKPGRVRLTLSSSNFGQWNRTRRAILQPRLSPDVHVVVVGRNAQRGKETVDEIRAAGGKADFIRSDLRDAASAPEVAKKTIELGDGYGDILINNAGMYPFGPIHEMTEEQLDRVFSLNAQAPYFLVEELAPLMAKRGKGARKFIDHGCLESAGNLIAVQSQNVKGGKWQLFKNG